MESNQLVKQARIRAIIMATVLVLAFLSFLYGLINNIQMQQERKLATATKEKQLACEAHATELAKQIQEKDQLLILAIEETLKLKQSSFEQASIAAKRK